VLGVLPPVVAAFTEAEIEAGMHPDAEDKANTAWDLGNHLVGTDRFNACMNGEDPLSNMLIEADTVTKQT